MALSCSTQVWGVLEDWQCYGEWNPFVTSISGDKTVGSKLRVTLQFKEGAKPWALTPKVTTLAFLLHAPWLSLG